MKTPIAGLAVASLCVILAGCGQSQPTNREPVYPIRGQIMHKGTPVAGADVTFYCEEKNRSAFGRTDDQGRFRLTTYSSNDGAVAGKHAVTVSKHETPPPTKVADTQDTAYVPPGFNESTDPAPPKNLIPTKYADTKTTDLIVVVNADSNNSEVVLDLKD
jgi:hypothetical protein